MLADETAIDQWIKSVPWRIVKIDFYLPPTIGGWRQVGGAGLWNSAPTSPPRAQIYYAFLGFRVLWETDRPPPPGWGAGF